ncbi:dTDP-glucose 4,6-dehydratase [Nitrospira sp. KM1]|uniref:dTDP-glucose 4,6-dehydratase n=1 Tax=Nitrospira sp. KM1 TaxID=1936990 RepID=UPI0013A7950D|nr:dTDP-glucose 4,6-dehydratase [Nitrospira sp. KM1]BCA54219.1 dTDP-glucose 4,6-dehydratase [Nitrospira sp. KM1]
MKTILITGGAGFIGSNFVRYLYDKYPEYRLIVLDALTYAGNIKNLPVDINSGSDERLVFWYGNVRNGELVDTIMSQSDAVVHFAAESHVTRSIYDNLLFFETDVLGTQTVANAVLKYRDRIERFVHISTSEVYGTAMAERMSEDHPLLPMSPYASAKCGADRLVYSYWETYKIPAIIVRPFNNYGPYQHLEKVVPRFITSCLLGEPLTVHGDGTAARDFLHVQDHCEALDLILHASREKVVGEVINIGTGCHTDLITIANTVRRLMRPDKSPVQYIGDRPGQVFRHTCDNTRASKLLGWAPKISFEEGLDRTVRWYRDNETWWRPQMWMRHIPIVTAAGKRELH